MAVVTISGKNLTLTDVIDIKPDITDLETMLDRFRPEHLHDKDEVRFIVVKGCGIFHIAPASV